MPGLCLYLLWGKLRFTKRKAEIGGLSHQGSAANEGIPRSPLPPIVSGPAPFFRVFGVFRGNSLQLPFPTFCFQLLFYLLALAWLPTRLIQQANPEWRLVSWALALIVIGITFGLSVPRSMLSPQSPGASACSAYSAAPGSNFNFQLSTFSFPLLFFLVAVPWPTIIEGPLIQALTRANAAMTIELLGFLGTPAVQHGNLIEVATGVVGIDEACSGIRSFQATLMISLFFGELYRLSIERRLGLVLAGFALAFVFNVARTVLLVSVAAAKEVSAIASWHDPAGVTILVGCFVSLWGVAELLKLKKFKGETLRPCDPATPGREGYQETNVKAEAGGLSHQGNEGIKGPPPGLELSVPRSPVVWALLAFVLLSEISVEGWYRWHERRLPAPVTWTVQLPTDDRTYSPIPIPPKTQQYLRYDEGLNGSWMEGENRRWQAIFLRWNPGATAVHLAKNHTPEVCLTAAGRNVEKGSELRTFQVGELQLPFRVYHILDADGGMYVFYCLWPDRAERREFDTTMLTYANRLAPVFAGIRNSGQRSLEVAVWGIPDRGEAEAAFQRELEKMIKSGP